MFSAAVIDEVIDTSPIIVAKGVLPKNVDKDPAWRATALYERDELVGLISDPIIPPERRMLNAIKGLAGTRHGEAAGLRWSNYFADVKPLGKLLVARSYDKDGTKTDVSRLVPVHQAFAAFMARRKPDPGNTLRRFEERARAYRRAFALHIGEIPLPGLVCTERGESLATLFHEVQLESLGQVEDVHTEVGDGEPQRPKSGYAQ